MDLTIAQTIVGLWNAVPSAIVVFKILRKDNHPTPQENELDEPPFTNEDPAPAVDLDDDSAGRDVHIDDTYQLAGWQAAGPSAAPVLPSDEDYRVDRPELEQLAAWLSAESVVGVGGYVVVDE